ncbi:hypothetical protein BKK81_09120 [Cupriavidus sp. USMAHM13]|uniref:DUF4142 domain-containing protein n=1 Tax=Cupriavidus malaysiensis TaxID=367825 RepID=A0A1D9I1U9_9BURK|nr:MULTISPECIES: DUF4142 domain-containing protein [Cupriavidus]AOY99406.1 hypothetical protein BKK81_09120 [Cupriavidus sp. USMAHM13]AOZ06023.1 hypothetical protein BKK80_09405 [Cupriavidus malaysiensis]
MLRKTIVPISLRSLRALLVLCAVTPPLCLAPAGAGERLAQDTARPPAAADPSAPTPPQTAPPDTFGGLPDDHQHRPGGRSPPDTALTTNDLRFLDEAVLSLQLQRVAARLARNRARDAGLKELSARTERSYTQAQAELEALAKAAGVEPVERIPEAAEAARLRTVPPDKFDGIYLQTVCIEAQAQYLTLLRDQASRGRTPGLRAYAARWRPRVLELLEAAGAVKRRLGAGEA